MDCHRLVAGQLRLIDIAYPFGEKSTRYFIRRRIQTTNVRESRYTLQRARVDSEGE